MATVVQAVATEAVRVPELGPTQIIESTLNAGTMQNLGTRLTDALNPAILERRKTSPAIGNGDKRLQQHRSPICYGLKD